LWTYANEGKNTSKKKQKEKKKKIIQIKSLPPDHELLYEFCKEFEESTGLRLEYFGESGASLMDRAVQEIMVFKRRKIPNSTREAVLKKCGGKCAKCSDRLTTFEVDHIVPLRLQGLDVFENMQALCKPCHSQKCQQEENTAASSASTR
jgi:hypothetical protein